MTYRIGIISDLHLEFDDGQREWIKFNKHDADLWINAGDTHPRERSRQSFAEDFEGVPYFEILGNHDYWSNEFDIGRLIDCKDATFGDLKITGAPLWTDLSRFDDWEAFKEDLVDYRKINPKLTQDQMNRVHKAHLLFLMTSDADIIVSHHLPSYQSIHPKWKTANNRCNGSFASEYAWQIQHLRFPPKLWIHGHTHDPCDYMIDQTRVICNPRGYPGEGNWANYKPVFVEME
jgi:predicted phosphodiesterase